MVTGRIAPGEWPYLGPGSRNSVQWSDPTGDQACAPPPSWQHENMLTMLEYLTATYGMMCGSEAGYIRHRRAGEQACQHCLRGHRQYVKAWYEAHPRPTTRAGREAARMRTLLEGQRPSTRSR